MKLIRQTQLHFREGNSDKVYEVDLCETSGQYLVNFRYGRRGSSLKEGTKTVSPVSRAEAEKIFQKLVEEKTKKGYRVVSGASKEQISQQTKPPVSKSVDEEARLQKVLEHLAAAVKKQKPPKSKHAWPIERVIWRAGELKIKEAAPLLVQLIGTSNALRDYCIAWSLGWCGDENSLPALSQLYNNPNTGDSVRRIAGEAMMKLSDEEHRGYLRDRMISQLPPELRDLARNGPVESFAESLHAYLQSPARERYAALEQLYAVDNEYVRPALLKTLRAIPFRPNSFKTVRHIFKIAEYRYDAEVFGVIARRFEDEKAGYQHSPYWDSIYLQKEDGKYEYVKRKDELKSPTARIAYGNNTRDYFCRRTWRALRALGEIGDAEYVKMAVGALLSYTDADAMPPRESTYTTYFNPVTRRYDWRNPQTRTTYYDSFAPYILFNHILYENSPRYEFKTNSRAWRCKGSYKPGGPEPKVREEAFPKLWEKQPVGLLHLLSESECLPVHQFAVKALRDCHDFLDQIDVDAIIMLLERQYDVTAQFGFELAKKRYNPQQPNKELVFAVATCANADARAEGCRWIDSRRDLFVKDDDFLIALLTCAYGDTRAFAANLLRSTTFADSEAQILIARLIAHLVSFDESKGEEAKDLADAIFKSFSPQLRKLGMSVIRDLLDHTLVEVQELGGNILLNHETPAVKLPNDIITALIESPFESMRGIGIKLFGQLPDDVLLERESVIISLLTHRLEDVHNAIRPVIKRLAGNNLEFASRLARLVVTDLLKSEKNEGVHNRLARSLNEDLSSWVTNATIEIARDLISTSSPAAQEVGGRLIQTRAADWHKNFATDEIVSFTNNEIKTVREASWALANISLARFRAASNFSHQAEVSVAVRALDSRWEDSQAFWFDFFKIKLTSEDLTPDILITICDSVKDNVQKFGRDLLLAYFKEENGQDYMLKLSEHPTTNMQLFVTNYLERYAADSTERMVQLTPYFVRVLSSINKARVAKQRIYAFLETEAAKSEQAAQTVVQILERQSATIAITDKATAIELMLKIHCLFPQISLPLDIKLTEVRANAV